MPTRRRFLGATLIGGIAALLPAGRESAAVATSGASTPPQLSPADLEFRRYLRMAASAQAIPVIDS